MPTAIPSGGPWRQFHCTVCQGYFPEHHGTIFHGKQVAVELIVQVLACLAEGLGIRATARVFEVAPHTILAWLVEAAEQLRAFSSYFLCDVHVEQVQLDELYAVLRDLKAGAISADEAIERVERSRSWVWTVLDPTSKLLVVVDVGTRTLAMAQRVVHQLVQVLAPGCVPLYLTDGFKEYRTTILTHFGHWMQRERRQDKGPMPKPRWMPLPELLYAQVIKSYRRRRIVGVTHHVAFGTRLAIAQVLARCGWTIDTAFVERLNLDIRQGVAAVGRRGEHPLPERSGLAGSVGAVSGLSQLRLASREFAPGAGRAHPHQRQWLSQGVAAVLAGDGSGFDGSRLVAQRGAVLPGSAVAPSADALTHSAG